MCICCVSLSLSLAVSLSLSRSLRRRFFRCSFLRPSFLLAGRPSRRPVEPSPCGRFTDWQIRFSSPILTLGDVLWTCGSLSVPGCVWKFDTSHGQNSIMSIIFTGPDESRRMACTFSRASTRGPQVVRKAGRSRKIVCACPGLASSTLIF